MIKRSSYDFAETVARLSDAIVNGGNTIVATIDQAQAASGVGLALRPMSEIAARHGVTGMDQRIAAMDAAQIALSSSV